MSDAVDTFVEQAQGVRSATSHHEGAHIHVYHGKLANRDGTVRILTLAPTIDDAAATEAFMQTAGKWQNASTHPNIVTVYDRGETPRPWVATADVDAQPLDAAQPNLEPAERATVVADAAEAIRNAALYNIVHGALSPEHIVVVPGEDGVSAVVDDWGLRQAVQTAVDELDITPYTAPELLEDSGAGNERTDVYGLGVVAYYLLTSDPPVSGTDLESAIREGEVTPPSKSDETLSEAVDDALLQALFVAPGDRHESAYAFKRAFAAAYSPEPAAETDDTTAAAGAAAVGAADGDETATDDSDEDSSALTTRRTALGALGVGVVGLGGGWLATQMGGEGDTAPATGDTEPGVEPTEEPTEEPPAQTTTSSISASSITAQNGLAYYEGHMYAVSDGEILKIERSTDDVVNRFSAPSDSRPTGLAYGNGSLWFADAVGPDYDGEIAELNPDTGEVRSSITSSWDPRGLAFGDGSLWAVDITTNSIVEFSPDGDQLSSFDTPGVTWGQGLAYFDGSLWLGNNCSGDGCTVSLREYDTDGNQIQRTGERTSSSTSPYAGLAATETELLGPGPDGEVTVLRTL